MFWLLPAFAFLATDIGNRADARLTYGKRIAKERGVNLPEDKWDRLRTVWDLGGEAEQAAGGAKELIAVRNAEARADEAQKAGAAATRVLETVYGEQPSAEELLTSRSLPMLTAADRPVYQVATEPARNETDWALLAGAGLLAWAWVR
jgi:hypothetical protein